jgi:hypothetical protein
VSRRADAHLRGLRAAARRLASVLLAIAIIGGCSPQTVPPTPDVTSPVEGVIIAIDSAGLADVRGFTLRVSGGFAFEFALGPLENPTAFPPGHLAEHQATSSPVRVFFRLDGGRRVVYRLEDAVPSPAPSSSAWSSSPSG